MEIPNLSVALIIVQSSMRLSVHFSLLPQKRTNGLGHVKLLMLPLPIAITSECVTQRLGYGVGVEVAGGGGADEGAFFVLVVIPAAVPGESMGQIDAEVGYGLVVEILQRAERLEVNSRTFASFRFCAAAFTVDKSRTPPSANPAPPLTVSLNQSRRLMFARPGGGRRHRLVDSVLRSCLDP
jgi:hypothetical protein